MSEILDKKINNHLGVEKNKIQIVLTHTSRNADEYLTSLRNRYNKKYNKLPHYIITREGIILQTMDDENYGKMLNNFIYDKQSIIISLENLGWLEKQPLKNGYINWIGNIYKGKVYEKKWRDFIFWDTYTEQQIESLIFLCKKLIKDLGIKKKFVGHNTKINGVENVEGILTRSNFFLDPTDLNPSFDFEYFLKKIEDE